MKKILLTSILIAYAILVSAQCVEVKGVETKKTCYEDCNPKDKSNFSPIEIGRSWHNGPMNYKYPKVGFSFTNLNKYQVTIEAEYWWQGDPKNGPTLKDTKTFVIEEGEEYIWKVGLQNNEYSSTYSVDKYYVKFKTFKCP